NGDRAGAARGPPGRLPAPRQPDPAIGRRAPDRAGARGPVADFPHARRRPDRAGHGWRRADAHGRPRAGPDPHGPGRPRRPALNPSRLIAMRTPRSRLGTATLAGVATGGGPTSAAPCPRLSPRRGSASRGNVPIDLSQARAAPYARG